MDSLLLTRPRNYNDMAAPNRGYLLTDLDSGPFSDGYHDDYRRHTDDNAKYGKERTHHVCPKRFKSDS